MPRGFNELADVQEFLLPPGNNVSAAGIDYNQMWNLFQQSIAQLNNERSPLLRLLTFPVTQPVEQIRWPVIEGFEKASEFGVPKGVRVAPAAYTFGYNFDWFDIATRYTWQALLDMSPQQLLGINNSVLAADIDNQYFQVMRTIFNSANETATIYNQNVNVYRFWNADGTVPQPYKTITHDGTHTHYLTTNHLSTGGGLGPDSADLEVIETHFRHHGISVQNGYRLVLLVNPQEGARIREFRRGTDSQPGTSEAAFPKYDFIPGPDYGGGIIMPEGQIMGGQTPLQAIPGFVSIGVYGPFTIVEDDMIPAGYMAALATGGELAPGNPVGVREHDNAAGRGLQLLGGPERDYPLKESYYVHGFGTGIRNRSGGVVMQVRADSAVYQVPAAYV
jgi:hypothetical protein